MKPIGCDAIERVLFDDNTWRVMRLWTTFTNTIWKAHAAEYEGFHRGMADSHKYYAAYAKGIYKSRVVNHFDGMRSVKLLEEAGLQVTVGQGQKAIAMDETSALYQHELAQATMVFDIVFYTVKHRTWSHSHYTSCLPGRFGGLLGDEASQSNTLEWLEVALRACRLFEENRHVYAEAKEIWDCVPWFSHEVPRELLTMLDEFGFKWCTPHVEASVKTMFAWGSSLVNELAHKEVRHQLQSAGDRKLIPQTMYKNLMVPLRDYLVLQGINVA